MKIDLNTTELRFDVHPLPEIMQVDQFPNSAPLGRCIVGIEVEKIEIDRREQERLANLRELQTVD